MSGICKGITEGARRRGACGLLDGDQTLPGLLRLLYTPQGREFCAEADFPPAELLGGLDRDELREAGVYADAGKVEITGRHNILLTGATEGEVTLEGTKGLHHLIVTGGAKARVTIKGYAVGDIEVSAGSEAEMINEDGTGRIRWHRH